MNEENKKKKEAEESKRSTKFPLVISYQFRQEIEVRIATG